MLSEKDYENKALEVQEEEPEEKPTKRASGKVQVRLNKNRAIAGLGGGGEIVEVSKALAEHIIAIGYGKAVK